MQSKIEQFIQDSARRTVLVGHRQAWSWQDEWFSLTIEDVRRLEAEVQSDLRSTSFGGAAGESSEDRQSNDRRGSLYLNSPNADQCTEEMILGLRMTSIEEDSDDSTDIPDSDDEYVDALGMSVFSFPFQCMILHLESSR